MRTPPRSPRGVLPADLDRLHVVLGFQSHIEATVTNYDAQAGSRVLFDYGVALRGRILHDKVVR